MSAVMDNGHTPTARIVGGGFVGLSCALQLQADGFNVELFDAGADEDAASFGNAGHLAIEQSAPLASWANVKKLPRLLYSRGGPAAFPISQICYWMPFAMRLLGACASVQFERGMAFNRTMLSKALDAWRGVLQRVGQLDLLSNYGHELVWESKQSAESGLRAWQSTDLGGAQASEMNAARVRELSQKFGGKPVAGLQFSGTGHLRDLQAVRTAMREAFVRAGGVWHRKSVRQVRKREGWAQIELNDSGIGKNLGLVHDLVIVCAGAHSADLMRDDFGRLPMIAERGYHLQLTSASVANHDLTIPLVFEDRSLIMTPFHQGLRLASFTEYAHTQAPPDPRKWQRLKQHAAALGMSAGTDTASTWVGCRPTLPDYLPVIGRSQQTPNLIVACGHHHLGLTLAALTGQLVSQLARQEKPMLDLSAVAPQRFISHF
jgi:D-hydroxyproline dehydrogenase